MNRPNERFGKRDDTVQTFNDLRGRYHDTFALDATMTDEELRDSFHRWGGMNYARDGAAFLRWLWNGGSPLHSFREVDRQVHRVLHERVVPFVDFPVGRERRFPPPAVPGAR